MSITLYGEWDEWVRRLDGADFRARLRVETERAFKQIGLYMVGAMRRAIRSGVYAKNSPFTIAYKGSSKPLVDHGDLIRALAFEVVHADGRLVLFVGINRKARSRTNARVYDIALALHEGFSLRVTPAMRRAVWAKLRQRRPKSKFRGDPSFTRLYYHIPPRPFIMGPVTDPDNFTVALRLMWKAYRRALGVEG